MDIEVIDFFESQALAIPKLLKKKPARVSDGQVEAACVSVFNDRHSIRQINLAREVWRRAVDLDDGQYRKDRVILKDTKKAISDAAAINQILIDQRDKIIEERSLALTRQLAIIKETDEKLIDTINKNREQSLVISDLDGKLVKKRVDCIKIMEKMNMRERDHKEQQLYAFLLAILAGIFGWMI